MKLQYHLKDIDLYPIENLRLFVLTFSISIKR